MKKISLSVISIVVLIAVTYFGWTTYNNYSKHQTELKNEQLKINNIKKQKLELNNKKQAIEKKYTNLISQIQKANENNTSTQDSIGGGFEKPTQSTINADKVFDNEKYSTLEDNTFSLYVHNNSTKPLIMAIHGGAFMIGTKEMEYPSLKKFYDQGFNVMSINYTLSGTKKFPQAIYDVKEAIKYIKANYKKYFLNNTKIVLKGESAGGHLATLAGLSSSLNKLNNTDTKYPNIDASVIGIIDQFGPIDFVNVESEMKQVGISPKMGVPTSPTSPESKYFGELVTKDSKLVQSSNPHNYINKNMPPIYIQAGYKDNMVGILQSVNFAKQIELKLIEQKNKVTTTWFENAGHGGSEFETDQNINTLSKWINNLK